MVTGRGGLGHFGLVRREIVSTLFKSNLPRRSILGTLALLAGSSFGEASVLAAGNLVIGSALGYKLANAARKDPEGTKADAQKALNKLGELVGKKAPSETKATTPETKTEAQETKTETQENQPTLAAETGSLVDHDPQGIIRRERPGDAVRMMGFTHFEPSPVRPGAITTGSLEEDVASRLILLGFIFVFAYYLQNKKQ